MKIILFVEDDDLKARSVMRWATRMGVEMLRVTTMVAACRAILHGEGITAEIGAVLTDWQFPFRDGEHARDHAGERVVHACREQGLAFAVFSGRDAPVKGVEPWIESTDIQGLTTWLEQVKTTL